MADASFARFQVFNGMNINLDFPYGKGCTAAEFKKYVLTPLQEVLDSGNPFTLYVNTSELGTVPFSIGVDVVQFMKQNRPKFRDFCRASAIVVNTEFISGLLQWIFALSPPVSPNIVVSKAQNDKAVEFIAAATAQLS